MQLFGLVPALQCAAFAKGTDGMMDFKQFNIRPTISHYTGEKIKIAKILNCPVIIREYKVEASKYPKNKSGMVMTLQLELNDEPRIVFTGSDMLMDQIQQVPEDQLPFRTTIVKNGDHFEFT